MVSIRNIKFVIDFYNILLFQINDLDFSITLYMTNTNTRIYKLLERKG